MSKPAYIFLNHTFTSFSSTGQKVLQMRPSLTKLLPIKQSSRFLIFCNEFTIFEISQEVRTRSDKNNFPRIKLNDTSEDIFCTCCVTDRSTLDRSSHLLQNGRKWSGFQLSSFPIYFHCQRPGATKSTQQQQHTTTSILVA